MQCDKVQCQVMRERQWHGTEFVQVQMRQKSTSQIPTTRFHTFWEVNDCGEKRSPHSFQQRVFASTSLVKLILGSRRTVCAGPSAAATVAAPAMEAIPLSLDRRRALQISSCSRVHQ
eukprot:scaffold1503_cov150-Ochromonas_danica.AAC.12